MNFPPSPVLVAQSAVQPLPRCVLLLLCLVYTLAGFIGRDPWRNADMAAFATMRELALGHSTWLAPQLAGLPADSTGLLPHWLGAAAIVLAQVLGGGLSMEMAARLPFVGLLALTLLATWHSMQALARRPAAQPVAFAFGGEAQPADYARALADAALLALIACLGLAQLAHETTASLCQLACTAVLLWAAASLPQSGGKGLLAAAAGLFGLVLSDAQALAALLGLGVAALLWRDPHVPPQTSAATLLLLLAAAALAWALELWQWPIIHTLETKAWDSLLRLWLWFLWPAWPLALWTLWRWRKYLFSRRSLSLHKHLLLPLWFALIPLLATFHSPAADRSLLPGLPAFALLAAFALPTLGRSMGALIDWFALAFFSLWALVIWVIWLAVHTGIPAKPAANVAKLAPGYSPVLSLTALLLATLGTLAWAALVWWRTARTRTPLWKSLVLPAGGTTLCWLLMMTLWLPLLNYGRSFAPQVAQVAQAIAPLEPEDCVVGYGLSYAQIAALTYHGGFNMTGSDSAYLCHWAIADAAADPPVHLVLPLGQWRTTSSIMRPTDRHDWWQVLERIHEDEEPPTENPP